MGLFLGQWWIRNDGEWFTYRPDLADASPISTIEERQGRRGRIIDIRARLSGHGEIQECPKGCRHRPTMHTHLLWRSRRVSLPGGEVVTVPGCEVVVLESVEPRLRQILEIREIE